MKKVAFSILIIGLILIPGRLFAQNTTYEWTGLTDNNWAEAGNWNPTSGAGTEYPGYGANDTAEITDASIIVNATVSIRDLVVNAPTAASFFNSAANTITVSTSATLSGTFNPNNVDVTLPDVTLAANTVVTLTSATLTITGAVDGDCDLTLDAGTSGSLTLTGSSFGTTIDNLTIQAAAGNTNTLDLPAIDIDNDLTITMAGSTGITQSGVLDISGGTTTIDAAAAAITLTNAGNDFGTVAVTNGASASIRDTDDLILGTSALTGTFTVVAGGDITQSGDIEGDTLLVTTLNDAGAAITLNNAGNDFALVSLRSRDAANGANSSGVISYRDNDDFDVVAPGIATTNNLTLRAAGDVGDGDNPVISAALTVNLGGNDLNFANTNGTNDFDTVTINSGAASIRDADNIVFDVCTVSGNLTIQAGGDITQSGDIYNNGQTTTIIAGAADVTLTNAGNDFGTVAVTNGATVSIRDTNALIIGTSTVSGDLTLQSGGNLTQSGAIDNNGQTTTIIAGAANVTLTNASNDFGTVAVTNGATVSIRDANALEIGTSSVSGALTLQTGGTVGDNLTQIGTGISNDGQTTTIIAGLANVTLENTGNNFGTVAVTNGATVSIVDSNELILGTSTVSDTYTVVAGGDITQSGVLSVTLTSSFTAPGGDSVTLDAGWNDLQGTIDFNYSSGTSLLNVTLYNTPAITMAAMAVSGTLELRSRDSVSQSGILSGDTLIVTTYNDAGGAITLENAGNAFAYVSLRSRNLADGASSSGTISYRDTDGFDVVAAGAGLSGMETSGSLTLRGDGDVGDGTNPIIAGTLTVNLNNNDLDFSNADGDSDFGTVDLGTLDNVNDASFRDTDDIELGTCTVTGTLTVRTGLGATHSITQSGVVTVSGGTTTLQAGAGAITLDDASNNFATVVITSGAAVSIRDANALEIGTSSVSGALTLQSGGNLTQSGAIDNNGQTTTIIAGAADVTLTNAGNDFGTVAVTNGATVSIRDTNALIIGTSTVSGDLTLQSGGNLTQSGAIDNNGQTTTIIAGAANVTLTNASNDFGTVAVTNGATVSIRDANALEIGTSSVSGALTLQTGGTVGDNLTQIGTGISNDGQTTTIIAGLANVTLENTGNNFGTVAVTNGATVSIVDSNELILGTSTVSDTYTVVAGGDITQSGVLSVTLTSSFTAPGGDSVTLDAGWNDLQGTIDFNYSSGTSLLNVTLYNTPAITMAAMAVSGTLELRSRDSVSQSGILSGDTLIVTTYNDAGGAITLENAGNAFAYVSLRSRNLADGASSSGTISYRDTDGFDVVAAGAGLSGMETSGSLTLRGDGDVGDGTNPIIAGTLTVNLNNNDLDFSNADGDSDFGTVDLGTLDNVNDASFWDMNAIILGTCTVTGTLTVRTGLGAAHSITQSGIVTVSGGTTTLQAGAGAITLTNASNNFATVVITSGATVSIRDADDLEIGSSAVSGALTLQTGGTVGDDITQSGTGIDNDGQTMTIIAGLADVTLENTGNDFGTVAVTNGATVSLVDSDDLEIGTSSVTGTLTVVSGLGAAHSITQSGVVTVSGGTTTLQAGAGAITLDDASNNFATVVITSGAAVSIRDTDDLEIGTSSVSGALTLQTGGTVGDNLTQIGTGISNDGQTTTIIAGLANVTLENTGNNFGTVAVTNGATVSIVDSNELILGTSTVSDTYTVVAGGDITQSGVLSVTLTSSFTAPGGDSVTLDAGWNDLQGTIDFNYSSGTSLLNVTLYNTPAITMAAMAVSGTLELRSRDSVSQSGILSGDTLIVTTYNDAGGAITLENAGNAFDYVSLRSRNLADGASSSGTISYRDTDGFDVVAAGAGLSGMETSGSLTLRGDGDVGDGTNPIIAGTLTVNLNNNDLDFSNADGDSDFDTVNLGTIDNVNDASFRDTDDIELGTCTVTGTLTVRTGLGAAHSITQSGIVTVSGGTTTLQAGAGAITLTNASNNFATVVITSGAAVSIRDANALEIGSSSVSGALTLQSGGNLTQSGAIDNNGQTTTIIAGAANVTLTDAGNDFGTVAVTNGATVSIRDTDDLTLNAITATVIFSLNAGGAVTQNAAQIINSPGVVLLGTGPYTLTQNNTVTTLAGSTGDAISFTDAAGGITVGTVDGTSGITTSNDTVTISSTGGDITVSQAINTNTLVGDIDLTSSAAITLNAALTSGNGDIFLNAGGTVSQSATCSGTGLLLLGAGPFELDIAGGNSMAAIAADVTGYIRYEDANGITIGSITENTPTTYNGIITNGNNLDFVAGGNITIAEVVDTGANTGEIQVFDANGTIIITETDAADTITTAHANGLSLNDPIQLQADTDFTASGGEINLGGTATVNDNTVATHDLTLTAGGDINLGADIGGTTPPQDVIFIAGTGNDITPAANVDVYAGRDVNVAANNTYELDDQVLSAGRDITGSGTVTISDTATLTAVRDLSIAAVTVNDITGTATINVGRNLTSTTFTPGDLSDSVVDSIVVFTNGTAGGGAGAYNFHNLTVNDNGNTVTSTGNWTVYGDLTLTAGTWDLNGLTHTLYGDWVSTAANSYFDSTGSTVIFRGDSNTTVATNGIGATSEMFGNITISKDAANTLTLNSDIQIDGDLVVSAGGGALATGNYDIQIEGDWTYSDTAAAFNSGSGGATVTFVDQSDADTVSVLSSGGAGNDFRNLVIDDCEVQVVNYSLTVNNLTINDDTTAGSVDALLLIDSGTSGGAVTVNNNLEFTKSGDDTLDAAPVFDLYDWSLDVANNYDALITDASWTGAACGTPYELGRLRVTGSPADIDMPYSQEEELGIVEFYNAAADLSVFSDGTADTTAYFWHLIINGCAVTMGQDITVFGHSGEEDDVLTEPVEDPLVYDHETELMGIYILGGGSLDTGGNTINLYGSLNNDVGTFTHSNGTFNLLGDYPALIAGDNTFYGFTCLNQSGDEDVRGKIVYFEQNSTTTILNDALANFDVRGSTPPASYTMNTAIPDSGMAWVYLVSSDYGTDWAFNKGASAGMNLEYVYLRDSDATSQPQVLPDNAWADDCIGWFREVYVDYSVTVDDNHDGRLESILVTSVVGLKRAVDNAYDDVDIIVDGYTVTGFSDGPLTTQFHINLEPSDSLDTGVTPAWRFDWNNSLIDNGVTGAPLAIYPSKDEEIPYDSADPIIGYTLAVADSPRNEVFIHFSEPLESTDGTPTDWTDNFDVSSLTGSPTVSSCTVVTPSSGSTMREALLVLSDAVTVGDVYNNVNITVQNVQDVPSPASTYAVDAGDPVDTASGLFDTTHRVSDIALGIVGNGIVEPVVATGNTQPSGGVGVGIITDFDGSDYLQDEDIELQAHLHSDLASVGIDLYWDNSVTSAYQTNGLWLPDFTETTNADGHFSGLVPSPWTLAYSGSMTGITTNLYENTSDWLSTNSKIVNGTDLDFLFYFPAQDLYAARCQDDTASNWYRLVRPWSFKIRNVVTQAGGISILNNIINPNRNERTTVHYELSQGGTVVIQVFDLAGGLVEVLQRGYQSAGEYSVSWNGRNRAGNVVARGIYFVRYVGPGGIDQIRKVLVVK